MKVIKDGVAARRGAGGRAGVDIPLDEIAAAFGVSESFFTNAFETGLVEARATEDSEGTIVITFRMGGRELEVGLARADDAPEDEEPEPVPQGETPGDGEAET